MVIIWWLYGDYIGRYNESKVIMADCGLLSLFSCVINLGFTSPGTRESKVERGGAASRHPAQPFVPWRGKDVEKLGQFEARTRGKGFNFLVTELVSRPR